jgi:glycine/sarcosine N-methyltransferase
MEMYDSLSKDYDYFVNWPERLAYELPFIEAQIGSVTGSSRSAKVLDAACGTGMHAIALAQRGYAAAGTDLSAGMIEQAVANAASAGVQADFQVAGFGALAERFAGYDALLCLGNSLPHVLDLGQLAKTLSDFAACLRPGGLLLLQQRNFDAVLAQRARWMKSERAGRAGEQEWLFVRFYDFDPDGLLTFNIITLARAGQGDWGQKVDSTRLCPLRQDELSPALEAAGFDRIFCYGSMTGEPFDPLSSGNLVISARAPL